MFNKKTLERLYYGQGKSQQKIAKLFSCSLNTITYWMNKHQIKRRSISDAIYLNCNPEGDPFKFITPQTKKAAQLYGIGLGLYWGEGTKANKNSVRLGNTDPKLIKVFMEFLIKLFGVKKRDFRFSLQIFTDIDKNNSIHYWCKYLGIRRDQFTKPTVSPSQSRGTYKRKSEYGVVTLYYHNKKLRNTLMHMLESIN